VALGLGALAAAPSGRAAAATRPPAGGTGPLLGLFGPAPEVTDTAWLVAGLHEGRLIELRADRALPLLERYLEPWRDHSPEWRTFFRGAYGVASFKPLTKLRWLGEAGPEALRDGPAPAWAESVSLDAPRPIAPGAWLEPGSRIDWALARPTPEPAPLDIVDPKRPCPRWKAPPEVSFIRYDGWEPDRFALVDCQGGLTAEAADRLAVLARAPGTPRPELPLPLEPENGAEPGEWLPRVRLLHPRLLWIVEKIAEAFPGRGIWLVSGYRRDGHGSLHRTGRALDLSVAGVPNEELFALCKSLSDVGCGFYPNNKFVHVDVRPHGTERVLWVDVAEPGQPSRYVDGWASLIPPGRAWQPR
jgi:hypothetical protein